MASALPFVDPTAMSGEGEMFVPHPCVSISLQRSDRQGWQEAGNPENQIVIP